MAKLRLREFEWLESITHTFWSQVANSLEMETQTQHGLRGYNAGSSEQTAPGVPVGDTGLTSCFIFTGYECGSGVFAASEQKEYTPSGFPPVKKRIMENLVILSECFKKLNTCPSLLGLVPSRVLKFWGGA